MFQAMLIKWAIGTVIDLAIDAIEEKVADTDNDLTREVVEQLKNNKELIKATVKGKL